MVVAQLLGKLGRRIYDGVDLATESNLSGPQRVHDILERDIADNHQIDVAATTQRSPRRRTENECCGYPFQERIQCGAKHLDRAGGLQN